MIAAQSPLFLKTKFNPPCPRPGQISRPRLQARLHDVFKYPLTIIVGPAGSGKSALLAEWIAMLRANIPGASLAWLNLEPSDDDPIRFRNYLLAALQSLVPAAENPVQAMLKSTEPLPYEMVLGTMINELYDFPGERLLILDDVHFLENPAVFSMLAFLLDHLPPGLHLVISTRIDPLLALNRLRSRGQLLEIRQDDLRFTLQETQRFFSESMGLSLNENQIVALENRTEGWIAGLYMAGLSLQKQADPQAFILSFTGSSRYIFDYLMDEVLQHEPPATRDFLQKTSMLDKMCAGLCAALVYPELPPPEGIRTAQEMLDHLVRTNLFTLPLDDQRTWFRYHHIFAGLLQHQLKDDAARTVIFRRAAAWYETNGYYDEAIQAALQGEDLQSAVRLIERQGQVVLFRGEVAQMRKWLAGLPAEVIDRRPNLSLINGWVHYLRGEFTQVFPHIECAETCLDADYRPDAASAAVEYLGGSTGNRPDMLAEASVLRAITYRSLGQVEPGLEAAAQALALANPQNTFIKGMAYQTLGGLYTTSGETRQAIETYRQAMDFAWKSNNLILIGHATYFLSQLYSQCGELHWIEPLCQEILKQLAEVAPQGERSAACRGMVQLALGGYHLEQNQLERAGELIHPALKVLFAGGILNLWAQGCILAARLEAGLADRKSALKALPQMRGLSAPTARMVSAAQARCSLPDSPAIALSWFSNSNLSPEDPPLPGREYEQVTLVQVLLYQAEMENQPQAAGQIIPFLERLIHTAEKGNRRGSLIELHVLQGLAHQILGAKELAVAAVARAVDAAWRGGYQRIFLDYGASLKPLLVSVSRSLERGPQRAFIETLLMTANPETGNAENHPQNSLIEPLSERELEVLKLLANGLSNQEIARKLVLSANTIKAHTNNIYGKLGAQNRTEAAQLARKFGLLE